MNDAGDGMAMFGADHQHLAAVAVGDDLFLQVLRRLASPDERIQCCPQSRLLLPEPFADRGKRGAGVVGHFAGGLDLAADLGDLALEGGDRFDERREQRERRCGAANSGTCLLDRLQIVGEAKETERLERATFDGESTGDRLEVRRRAKRKAGVIREETAALRRLALGALHGGSVEHRRELSQTRLAGRRDGEAGHDGDDAIEFEGPEGACVHWCCVFEEWGRGDLSVYKLATTRGAKTDEAEVMEGPAVDPSIRRMLGWPSYANDPCRVARCLPQRMAPA